VREWQAKQPGSSILLQKMEHSSKVSRHVIYSQNANAADYTKCLGHTTTRPTNEKIVRQDRSTMHRNEDAPMDYATFVNIVGKYRVGKF